MSARHLMLSFASFFVVAASAVLAPGINSSAAPVPTLMKPDEARGTVVSCGLPEHRVSVSYEQDMQEDIIWIASDPVSLPEPTLACMARASLKTVYYIYFRDEGEQRRYWTLYGKIANEVEVADAREWLRQRDLLKTIPLPEGGRPLADYTKAVEAFCGIRPGTLLLARAEDAITFAPRGLGRITAKGVEGAAATTEQFDCVMKVTSAADLQSRSIFFGFIGNAAANDR